MSKSRVRFIPIPQKQPKMQPCDESPHVSNTHEYIDLLIGDPRGGLALPRGPALAVIGRQNCCARPGFSGASAATEPNWRLAKRRCSHSFRSDGWYPPQSRELRPASLHIRQCPVRARPVITFGKSVSCCYLQVI